MIPAGTGLVGAKIRMRKILPGVFWLLALSMVAIAVATRFIDRYQGDGALQLSILKAPVRVTRDEQGIAYIHAESLDDAIRAQGWVTAQDRGFQLEFERYLSSGRQAAMLAPADRRFYELYLEGVNAYIANQAGEHQFGFGLLGMTPSPWTLEDAMTLQIFFNWQSSVNLKAELLAQELSDRLGPARAAEIRQITINPDDGSGTGLEPLNPAVATTALDLRTDPAWFSTEPKAFEIGSNQWVMSGNRSTRGAPVLANDPHLDARTLPGIWHPVGLITPEFRAVGVAGPGIPGIAVGRTSHVTFGVTNAYADVIDLFIESEDPDRPGHYLEGDQSYPFEIIEETLRVRKRPGSSEFREVPLRIRLTHRGPVISDHGMGVADGKLIAMRWSAPEAMQADTGAFALFTAKSVDEARTAIGRSTAPYNYVTDGTDAWGGFIPWEQMPGQVNPARGWVGNANHRTVPGDYATPYSTYFAASWRYRRMLELLDGGQTLDAEDHWAYMRDTKNLMAVRVAPLMSAGLKARHA